MDKSGRMTEAEFAALPSDLARENQRRWEMFLDSPSAALRDKFAMAALTGLLAEQRESGLGSMSCAFRFIGAPPRTPVHEVLPAACYAIADAMLAERAKRK